MRIAASILGLVMAAGLGGAACAEDAVGDWIGKVKAPGDVELTIAAHIKKTASGYEGYAESPDQVVAQLPLTEITATPDALSFKTPMVNATFSGKWDPAAKAWVGALNQSGMEMPLSLSRGLPPPRPTIAGLDGEWQGLLAAPQADLRLVLKVKTDAKGTLALFSSPDQSPMEAIAALTRAGEKVSFELKGVGGFSGTLSADGKSLDGQWKQGGGSLPLTLKKAG